MKARCVVTWCLVAATVACAGGAPGGDASAPPSDVDERPPGCDDVPTGFTCEGSTLRHCEDGVPSLLRCAAYTADAGTCGLVSPRYGSYCVAPDGAPCRMAVRHGSHDHVYFASCAAARSGCVVRVTPGLDYESACVPEMGTCDASLVGRCLGTSLVTRCERGMPVTYDCASFGGRCDPRLGVCVGVAEGARCGASFVCAEGLSCAQVRRGVSACRR